MRCDFFATESDLHPVLEQVEISRDLCYAVAGFHIDQAVASVATWKALSPLQSQGRSYLVFEAQFPLVVRPVPQRKGGTRFAVDLLENPNAISLDPGVRVNPLLLHPGVIGTTAAGGPATKLVRAYKAAIKGHFAMVKSYWVGPEALEVLRSGARLTVSAAAPREFDLTEATHRAA